LERYPAPHCRTSPGRRLHGRRARGC
jgi:hypothetical protein